MKLAGWLILPIAIILLVGALAFQFRSWNGTFSTSNLSFGTCQSGDQIDAETREAISSAALQFVEAFERSPMQARREMMSRRGRNYTPERGPIEAAHSTYLSLDTASAPAVIETYLVRYSAGSEAGVHIPCSLEGGRAVFVSRGGTPTSAVVVMTEEISGASQRATSVWLEHENSRWRVRAFHFGLSRIAGKSSEQLWQAAQQQRAAGHDFNATMLYIAAQGTLGRGSFYRARIAQDFNADIASFTASPLMQGQPPHEWRFGDERFLVTQVQYTGFENGEVGLIIDHSPANWTESAEAEAINRRLIANFVAAHPEWRQIFHGIVARAAKPNSNERWGTVFGHDGFSADQRASPVDPD